MQKPIVVVQLAESSGGFNIDDNDKLWGYMEYWVNEIMLPYIERTKKQ